MDSNVNQLEVIAARMSIDGKDTIRLHNVATRTTPSYGDIEYVDVTYNDERNNLLSHYERFTKEDCPYNQVPRVVPYIVIKNDVYEIESFRSVGYEGEVIKTH